MRAKLTERATISVSRKVSSGWLVRPGRAGQSGEINRPTMYVDAQPERRTAPGFDSPRLHK